MSHTRAPIICSGGERGPDSAFPNPTAGAVLVTADGRILGKGRSDYMRDAVQAAIIDSGLKVTPLKEWCVDWVPNQKFRDDLASSTLYVTLEPSIEGRGDSQPSITKLIEASGIPNVVVGCPCPIPEMAYQGSSALHKAGLSVRVLQPDDPLHQECASLIPIYTELANSKVSLSGPTLNPLVFFLLLDFQPYLAAACFQITSFNVWQENNFRFSEGHWAIFIVVLSTQIMWKHLLVMEMPLGRISTEKSSTFAILVHMKSPLLPKLYGQMTMTTMKRSTMQSCLWTLKKKIFRAVFKEAQ